MTLSLLRKSALAFVAIAGLASTPVLATGYDNDSEVIYADEGFNVVREQHARPLPPRHVEPQWHQEDEYLSPRRISRMLRQQGYARVAEISLRGDVYRVIAIRRNGALVRLKIDAGSGYILSSRRIGWAPRYHIRNEPGFTIQFGWDSRR